MKLVFATNNKNKLKEVRELLPTHINLFSLDKIGYYKDIKETGKTLQENALIKARLISKKFNVNCFSDDTGLEVKSLNGNPGVYSARYAGISADSEKNMKKLLIELGRNTSREAQFKTVIALILNNKEYLFEGVCKGEILYNKQGKKGFGYDPIFKPKGYNMSFAEMLPAKKGEISHRGKAIKKLITFLNKI